MLVMQLVKSFCVGEQLRLFFVSELGWMAGDSDYCVSSAHARLLASELEPLLHDLNASISILLFRMYLPQTAFKVYFVARLSVRADTEMR